MAVVKCQNAAPMIHDAVVLDLGDLSRQAEALLERARDEAERIIADARAEAARQSRQIAAGAKEQGRSEGIDIGKAEGREQARAELLDELGPRLRDLESQWSGALADWNDARGELLMSAREDVLRLALALSRKITHRQLDLDPSIVTDQVQAALHMMCEPASPIVAVHPDDLDLIREVMPAIESALTSGAHISIREDASITRGGCRVRTRRGEIDATIETQLECIAAALLPDATTASSESRTPEQPD